MAALTANVGRVLEAGIPPVVNDLPVAASTTIYEGGALSVSSGNVRPLNGSDTSFAGFAEEKVDNSAGAAGALTARITSQGVILLAVTGVTASTAVGTAVYATDDNTFTLTNAASAVAIGRVHRVIGTAEAMVHFQGYGVRSVDTSEI